MISNNDMSIISQKTRSLKKQDYHKNIRPSQKITKKRDSPPSITTMNIS